MLALSGPDGAIGRILTDFGCFNKIKFKKLNTFFRWKDPARDIDANIPIGIDGYVDKLCNMYPHEAEGIREFHQKYYPLAEWVVEFEKRRGLNKMLYALINLPIIARLLALRRRTAADILDSLVKDPKAREILALPANLFGLHYSELDAAVFVMASLLFHVPDSSAYYPIGGSGKVSKILAKCFCDNGGELSLQTHVEGITFDSNGSAKGVVLKDKTGVSRTKTANCIINCSDLSTLVDKLCPEGTFPDSFVKKVHTHIPGRSLVAAWAGLDIDLKDYGIADYEIIHNNHMSEQMKDNTLIEQIARTADYSVLPTSIATVYSNIDPSCCRPGKSVISTSFIASYDAFAKTLEEDGRRGSKYHELKDRIEEQLVEHMSRATGIADLADHIEVIETATPLTFKRYTENSYGSFMGWMATPRQGAFSSFSSRTPIRNLFQAGQWLGIGGVQSVMVSGIEASNIALRYLEKLDEESEETGETGNAMSSRFA
mmetsp:Transcript_19827/g.30212  ORF Transcript_19827/g.30212 Transcript_19827/m.30212 type:complete len:487 (-) Transcript_19827:92-1552(-)